MRIGLSCTTIEPLLSDGKIDGIGTYTKNLYDEISRAHSSLVPVSFPNQKNSVAQLPNSQLFPFSYTRETIASLINPYRALDSHLSRIDLFHATDHMIPKLKKIPLVATLHDALMFKFPEWFLNTRFPRLKKWARASTLRWPTHFITVSHSMVKELVEYCGIPENKITAIYNGISPFWFETVAFEEKQRVLQKFSLTKKFILFTSTLHPKKNLPRLIRAYLKLPKDMRDEFQLIVVGRQGWGTEESMQTIQQLESSGNGRWLDYVSLEELRALFQSASVYAHPSLHEGFGLTLLQAFASGTPVLTSNITAMPEIANDAGLLVDPYSEDAIHDGLQKVLLDSTLREKLIAKGSARVKEFSWEKCARETLNVYSNIE